MNAVTPDWLIEKLRGEMREATRATTKFAAAGGPDPDPKRTEIARIKAATFGEVMNWCREAETAHLTQQLNEKYKS